YESLPLHVATNYMSHSGKVPRFASNSTTCSTACASPRQFLRVSTLRPYSPGESRNALASTLRDCPPTPSDHRLRLGLPGYLIPFAPPAFASQRQGQARKPPSPLAFLPISTHFTATPGILLPSPALEPGSFPRPPTVEP